MTSIILAAHGRITTHFREDIGRGFPHNGIDQGHGDGNAVDLEIRAPADGVVIAHGWFGTYGNRLVIRHADGWTSLLAHHASQAVRSGDTVRQGQIVAVMGNTSTPFVHSHQELRTASGEQVDPLLNLSSSTASSTGTDLPMALDNDDHNWLNGMGASIVQQVIAQLGPQVWASPLTHESGAQGPASAWVMNTSDAVAALAAKTGQIEGLILALKQVTGGGVIDLAAITAASERGAADALAKLTVTIATK